MISAAKPGLDVAIIGGGISGICAAIGLLKYPNIHVTIYEASEQFSEIGAGLLLGPNAKRALNLISPKAHEAYTQLQTGNMHPGHKNTWYEFRYSTGPHAGERITKIQSETGQSSIHRAKFLDSLVRLVPKEIAQLGKALESIEESDDDVTLYFKDGTTAKAHCVIGADGVHSQTRRCIFKDSWQKYEPFFSGVVGFRALLPMDEARQVIGDEVAMNSFTHCGKDTVAASFPIDFGQTFNIIATTTANKHWEGPWVQKTSDFSEIQEAFKEWSPKTLPLIKALDRPNILKWSIWQLPEIPTTFRSRVCIIGDAAHATVPMHAAGAGQAIEDAFVIANVLGNVQVQDRKHIIAAFRGYDKIRRPRAQLNGRLSLEAVEIFSLRQPGVLDDPEALENAIEHRMDWLWNRDIALEAEQACLIMDNILQRSSELGGSVGVVKVLE